MMSYENEKANNRPEPLMPEVRKDRKTKNSDRSVPFSIFSKRLTSQLKQ